MDSPGPMMLPKGILMNSSTVYDEVAGYATLPADKVHKYWHVYTITNKKLKDPTARRLENFWWHVWGSDRSKLSGRVLAKIFEDISLGPTVVPLRGPANRWEGPDVPPLTIEIIMNHLQGSSLLQPKVAAPSMSESAANPPQAPLASTLRSSQLPPILKKVGSSSTSVSRNTARFVSPHESADEDETESEIPSSGSTLANGFEISGHALINTQSHVRGSEVTRQLQNSAIIPELASRSSTSSMQRSQNGESTSAMLQMTGSRQSGHSQKNASHLLGNTSISRTASLQQDDRESAPKLSARENVVLGKQPMMRRSQSSTVPDRFREPSMPKPKRTLFTEATSSTTNVAVQGTIIDQAGSIRDLPHISTSNITSDYDTSPHEESSASSLLETRLTPTQPSSSTILPLGRTKSQLTLLLEREKDRSRS